MHRRCKFLPFAMETLGAYGTQALDALNILAKLATSTAMAMPPRDFMANVKQALSCALQRGNALVVKRGAVNARASNAAAERAGRRR